MNKVICTTFGGALLLNVIIGLLFSIYDPFNVMLNSVMLLLNGAMILWVNNSMMKDGFKISLSSLFGTIAFFEFIAGFYSIDRLQDNPIIIAFLAATLFEVICIVAAGAVSKNSIE